MAQIVLQNPDTSEWTVKHRLPGRLRLQGRALQGDQELARGIEVSVRRVPGVRKVGASALTGAVLISFDPASVDFEDLLSAIRHAHRARNLRAHGLEDLEILALKSVEHVLANTDAAIRRVSRGKIGIRKLILAVALGRVGLNVTELGVLSADALEKVFDLCLTYILYKHHRLERELEKVESYLHPGA